MAERVIENLEDFLTISEVLIKGGIFSDIELRKILDKRTTYEYKICKRHPQKEDFLSYIKYDTSLLLLMNKRIKKTQFSHGDAILSRQFERLHYMYNNYHKKYRNDIEIYEQHIYLCYKMNETYLQSQVLSEMLRRNIKNVESWRLASKWYTINKNLEMSEKLYEKATTILKNDIQLWIAILEFHLLKIFHAKSFDSIRIVNHISELVDKAMKACQNNHKIVTFIVDFTKDKSYQYNLLLKIFDRIINIDQMDTKLVQIIVIGISKCPLELGSLAVDRVKDLEALFIKYHNNNVHHGISESMVWLLQLFTNSFYIFCQENTYTTLNIDLIETFLTSLKTLNKLFNDELSQFPYSDVIAIDIVCIYSMLVDCSQHDTKIEQHLMDYFVDFTKIFPKCSRLWVKYLKFIAQNNQLSNYYINIWCDTFIQANNNLTDIDAIDAASDFINTLSTNMDHDLLELHLNNFIDLFYKIHPYAINNVFLCILSHMNIVNIIIQNYDKYIAKLKSYININDITENFLEILTKNLIFSPILEGIYSERLSLAIHQLITFTRRLFELLVSNPTQKNTIPNNVDRWLSYIKFEKSLCNIAVQYNGASQSIVNNLYNRAVQQIESSLIQDFITKFTLMNVKSIESN